MNYCHECGSQIAEIDTFCPFCGISLKPVTVPESVTNEEDKTLLVNHGDLHDVLPQTESAIIENVAESVKLNNSGDSQNSIPNVSDSEQELENKSVDSNPVESNNEFSIGNNESSSEENQFVDKDINEFEPKFGQVEKTDEDSISNDVTLINVPTPQMLNDDSLSESANKNIELKIENPIDEFPTDETENIIDSENSEGFQDLEVGESKAEHILPIDEPVQTILDEDKNESEEELFVPQISQIEAPENLSAVSEPEQVIEKPEIPIEETENRDTTFDSVKIMDDGNNDPFDMQPENSPNEIEVQPEISQPTETNAESAEIKDKVNSPTTPNFGVGDTAGRKSPKLKPLDEGTVLNGRYEIVRKIGGGGMGAVYLATDRNLGGILRAVKEMIQSYVEEVQQDKAISDFKRESMLLTSLDHSSIPTIYDYFYDDKEGRFYLVMKYISGGDLASRLRAAPEGRIDEETVVSWAAQIADVLDYLHNRQPPIVYRDLKPANIMIDGNTGRTMLIDFGIARWINKEEKGVTAVGTMGYAPPELFSGKVEPSSDIYSLGSTMFHLLTGADPQSNPLLIFDFQKHPRPRQINPQLSDQIEKILLKMVEYSADKRYKTAGDARDALNQHLQSLKSGKATFGISKAPSAVSFSEQSVFCGFCGQKIVATDMFCAFCGSKQPLAQQGVHSAEYHLQTSTAKLFVIGTNELEVPTFTIEKDDNLVGRRDPLSNIFPEVDLSKYDPQTKISRRHAHIWCEGSNFLIEDLGSSNGTLVLRVVGDAIKLNPHQPYNLVNGEKIKIGDTTLHFIVG